MLRIRQLLASLALQRRGVTALEYGLIAAVVGGVVITAATGFGGSLSSAYSDVGGALTGKSSTMGT